MAWPVCIAGSSRPVKQATIRPACGPRVEVIQPVLDAPPDEECDQARRQGEGSTMSEIRTVVDGVTAAVKLAESLVALGLSTSKVRTYAPPREKRIDGWPLAG